MTLHNARTDVPDGEALAEMVTAGATYAELAEEYGCAIATIERRVKYYLDEPGVGAFPRRVGWLWEVPDWFDKALCAQIDNDPFFPEKGGSTKEAKSVCTRCTVSAECLDYALAHNERYGIWGGMSERERRKITADLDNQQEPA